MFSLTKNFRSFRKLSWSERNIFVQAVILLPAVDFLLRLFRFRPLYRFLARLPRLWGRSRTADARQIASVARMVDVAARNGPHDATCLRRSLVLWWLLRRRGIDSELRIGVGRREAEFVAHAWIVCENKVLNDSEEAIGKYRLFDWSQTA